MKRSEGHLLNSVSSTLFFKQLLFIIYCALLEIERKFIIRELPPNIQENPGTKIIQGYIAVADDGTEIRLRKKGGFFYLTVKSGGSLDREETEVELAREQFDKLWPSTENRRIEKDRHEIEHKGIIIELDIFRGSLDGLIIAEVEFTSIEESLSFAPPAWFGREVTEDERFKNKNLAGSGFPAEEGA